MNRFTEAAKKATTLAQIMAGREKLSTEDIIKKHPNGVHLTEIEYISYTQDGQDTEMWCFVTSEEPRKFSFGGIVINNMFNNILAEVYEGDITEMCKDFKEQGGISIKLSNGKTAKGRQVTKVEVL